MSIRYSSVYAYVPSDNLCIYEKQIDMSIVLPKLQNKQIKFCMDQNVLFLCAWQFCLLFLSQRNSDRKAQTKRQTVEQPESLRSRGRLGYENSQGQKKEVPHFSSLQAKTC